MLGLLAAVLISLAPVYLDNYRLNGYMRTVAAQTAPDNELREEVVRRATELNLPVKPGDVKITHPEGKRLLEANYVVEMNLALYQVDLHFHPHVQR